MTRYFTGLIVLLFSTLVLAAQPLPMITIDGDKFVADGREFKIWGFNMGNGLHLSDQMLQKQADQLEFLGVNMLRLHTIDWTTWGETGPNNEDFSAGLRPVGDDRRDTQHLVNVDKFFRFMDKLREKKIYIAVTLNVISNLVPGDADILQTTPEDKKAWIEAINAMNKNPDFQCYKILPVIDERAREVNKKWAADLLSLKNPKTGLKLAEDPQLALLNTANESSCWSVFYRNNFCKNLPEYFLKKYRDKWNAYLKTKYRTDEKLATAWTQKDKKGLLPGESLGKGNIGLLPTDPVSLPKEEQKVNGYPAFSEARRRDYVLFSFEMDSAHQRIMREHYRKFGWTRPCIYSDAAMGIDGEMGKLWMASDLFPYVEEHPYDEANIDPFMWGTIRIPTYLGSGFFGPEGPGRPIWGSEVREGTGWVGWTRIPGPLFYAAYYSLEGRDGLTWHVWTMNRDHLLREETMNLGLSWCHCNFDYPWLFAYRAGGRLFKSCEIKPLDKKDPARARFIDQWGGKCNADFSNDQVRRLSGENRAILTVKTEHFSAVATPYPQTVDYKDVKINLTAKTNNVVIVEKISDKVYEVTAVGTSGGMKMGETNHFNPQEYVAGSVTFKNRTIQTIDHINHRGEVLESVPGRGSEMPFVGSVRLYRVTLK
jgi:predicted lactoylglutathione lyase